VPPPSDHWPDRPPTDITAELVRLMPRDAVFMLRFLGESQLRLQRHFQGFIEAELGRHGVTPESHPLIGGFIEAHAQTLRDFVFAGVAMAHQMRLAEMERLLGDTTSLLSVDVWDQIRSHVETAEARFREQAPTLPEQLEGYRPPAPGED